MNAKFLKQKKADSKFLSIWWFAVIVVVAVGIVIGVEIFFSGKIDVRILESEILANKVINCLNERGYFNVEFLSDNKNIFSLCSLNEAIIDKSSNYFLKLNFVEADTKKALPVFIAGNSAFEKDCEIVSGMIRARDYPRCVYKKFSLLDRDNKLILVDLIAGSNQEYRLNDAK